MNHAINNNLNHNQSTLRRLKFRTMILAPSLIALSAAVLIPVKSLAWATCADIFLSQYEGLLENRAARMAMVMKRLPHLRPGTYPVTVKTTNIDGSIAEQKSGLFISYGVDGSLNLALGERQLIQSESSQRNLGLNCFQTTDFSFRIPQKAEVSSTFSVERDEISVLRCRKPSMVDSISS